MEFRVLNDIRRRIGLWFLKGTQPPTIAEPHESLTAPPVTPPVTPAAAPSDIPADGFRGIRDKDHVKGGKVQANAFEPPKGKNKNGYREVSVNWNDDDKALDVTFGDEKNSAFGVAKFLTNMIEKQRNLLEQSNGLSVERKRIDGNDYHGNILFGEIPPAAQKGIMNWIAARSEHIDRPSKPQEP